MPLAATAVRTGVSIVAVPSSVIEFVFAVSTTEPVEEVTVAAERRATKSCAVAVIVPLPVGRSASMYTPARVGGRTGERDVTRRAGVQRAAHVHVVVSAAQVDVAAAGADRGVDLDVLVGADLDGQRLGPRAALGDAGRE